MKLFKKFLVAGGVVISALGAPNASAVPVPLPLMVLSFFDGSGNRLASNVTSNIFNDKLSFNGFVNGWSVSATAGTINNADPLSIQIGGSIRKSCSIGGGTGAVCPLNATTSLGLGSQENTQIFNILSPNFLLGLNGAAPINLNNTAGLNAALGGVGTPNVGSDLTNNTLKIRLTVLNYAVPVGNDTTFTDSLSFTGITAVGTTATTFFTSNPGVTTTPAALGTINMTGTQNANANSNLSTVLVANVCSTFPPALPGPPCQPTVNLTFGFDLFSTGTQTGQQTFDFTNTVTNDVPEPGTLALIGLGLLAAGSLRRRKQA